jgi:dienelactone hydrolase
MPVPTETSGSAALPAADERAVVPPRDLDTHRTFPTFHTLAEWEARRATIRQQMLVSFGLYPLPPKTPLKARIFGKIVRDGYTIEKVSLQTYPGFYLAGNLYRPQAGRVPPVLSGGEAPAPIPDSRALINGATMIPYGTRSAMPNARFPGVLIAHGHWSEGRMANGPDGSIPARAITFARQGYVAFTYDMVGYNDTRQIRHDFANDRRHWLWGVTLMGLQTWNSIRALDFLASLPDVDRSRLAITGESGGGTQTMMLGALDDRLAAVGPCVMVSHTMQGGCLCENAPGLRIDFSNMEIAACAAPKVQIMVGASGDWTSTMMTVEGPAVESVYKLYGKPENLQYVLFNYGHNINKTSREAVYAAFGKWLLHNPNAAQLKEPPYEREPVADLRVFPDNTPLPSDAKDADALTDTLIQQGKSEVEKRKPRDRSSLTQFKKTFQPMWEHTLAVETPAPNDLLVEAQAPIHEEGGTAIRLHFGRKGRGDNIPALLLLPDGVRSAPAVVLVRPEGRDRTADRQPGSFVRALLAKGFAVLLPDLFLTGERADARASEARKPFVAFFTTYNRTDLQERVQDLITACAYLRTRPDVRSVALVGQGRAGLWTLLAAPAADAVAADCARLDLTTDDALKEDDLFTPGLRRLGDFHTAATLAAPHPLLLHDTGAKFSSAAWIADVYRALGADASLRLSAEPLDNDALLQWLTAAF